MIRRAVAWYARARRGYVAPSSGVRVRCTRGESVLFGEIYSDNGSWIQVLIEGRTLATLEVGPTAWKVEIA